MIVVVGWFDGEKAAWMPFFIHLKMIGGDYAYLWWADATMF